MTALRGLAARMHAAREWTVPASALQALPDVRGDEAPVTSMTMVDEAGAAADKAQEDLAAAAVVLADLVVDVAARSTTSPAIATAAANYRAARSTFAYADGVARSTLDDWHRDAING